MRRLHLNWIAVALLGAGLLGARSTTAQTSLDSAAARLSAVYFKLEQARYRQAVGEGMDSVAVYARLYRYLLADPDGILEAAVEVDTNDHLRRRRWRLLRRALAYGRVEGSGAVTRLRDSLSRVSRRVVPGDHLSAVILSADEPSAVQGIVAGLPAESNDNREVLRRLLLERNRVAQALFARDYLEIAAERHAVSPEELVSLLERIDDATGPAYSEILQELELSSGEQFPWWKPLVLLNQRLKRYDRFFPADSHAVWLKRACEGMGFDLDALPVYEETAGRLDIPSAAAVFGTGVPYDVRVVVTTSDGVAALRDRAAALSLALAYTQFDQGDLLFVALADPPWRRGVTGVLPELFFQAGWLRSVTGMSSETARALARLESQRRVVLARVYLRDAAFAVEALANPDRDLAALYGHLTGRYLGASDTADDDLWAWDDAWIKDPLGSVDALLGLMVGGQVCRYLQSRFGETPRAPEMAAFLTHSLFRFAGRFPWSEVVEVATGRPPDPRAAFAPLN